MKQNALKSNAIAFYGAAITFAVSEIVTIVQTVVSFRMYDLPSTIVSNIESLFFYAFLIVFIVRNRLGKPLPILFAANAVFGCATSVWRTLWYVHHFNAEHNAFSWIFIFLGLISGILIAAFLGLLKTDKLKYKKWHNTAKKIWFVPALIQGTIAIVFESSYLITSFQQHFEVSGLFSFGIMILLMNPYNIIGLLFLCKLLKDPKENTAKTTTDENKGDSADMDNAVFFCQGARGRQLAVYPNKVVIFVKAGAGSLLTGNATDGEKTIYFSDCIGIQYKKCGITLGYLQFETAGSMMNNKKNNFFNENTFTWDTKSFSKGLSEAKMKEVADYCKKRIDEIKSQKNQATTIVPAVPQVAKPSTTDEIREYKKLLDEGIITQEEFNAKKEQLLGL